MNQTWKYSILIFTSPLLGVFAVLKNFNYYYSKRLLILAVAMYGATLRLTGTSDGTRFQLWVHEFYSNKSLSVFFYELYRIIILQPLPHTKGDVYIHVLSYFCGTILNWPESLFFFVGLVFGYFYINGLSKIFHIVNLKWSEMHPVLKMAAIIFIVFLGIDMMQSIRTWTGAWVLFNGVVSYHKTGQSKYIFLILCAPLFHAAYFVMAIPSILVVFIKKFGNTIPAVFFMISFFVSFLPKGLLERVESNEFAASKLDSYQVYDADGNVISQTWDEGGSGSRGNFYAKYGKGRAPKLGTQIVLFWFIVSGFFRKKKLTPLENGLFLSALITATLANLATAIPQLNGRLYVVSGTLTTGLFFLVLARIFKEEKWKSLKAISKIGVYIPLVVFVPKLIYVLANFITYASWFLVAFPVLPILSEDLNLSIREWIGMMLLGE
jgi:hypothetical protein